MKGFKINKLAVLKGPVFYKTDNDDALVLEKIAQEHNKVSMITTKEDLNEVLKISGELSVSYGPASGSGSGSYLSKRISTKNKAVLIYVDRMSYYQIKFVNGRNLVPTRDVQGMMDEGDMNAIYNDYGTYITSAVQYGCSMYVRYEITSETDIDITEINAEITGKIGVEALSLEMTAKLKIQSGESKAKLKMDIVGQVSGMALTFPTSTGAKGFIEANDVIEEYNAQKKELAEAVKDITDKEGLEHIGLGKRFTPVAIELDSIDNFIKIPNMDMNAANFINEQTVRAGSIIQESNLLKALLEEERDALDKKYFQGRNRTRYYLPYRDAADTSSVRINEKMDECFNYLRKPVGEIVCGNLRAPSKLEYEYQDAVTGLLGNGYVEKPWKSESMFFEGYTLKQPNDQKKKPFYRGSLKCDKNEKAVLEDRMVVELKKFVQDNREFDEKECIQGGEIDGCIAGIVKGELQGGVVAWGDSGQTVGGAYRTEGKEGYPSRLTWTVPEPLTGDFKVRSEFLLEHGNPTSLMFLLESTDGDRDNPAVDYLGLQFDDNRLFYGGDHLGKNKFGGSPNLIRNKWHDLLLMRTDNKLSVSIDGVAVLTDLPTPDWTVLDVGWSTAYHTIQVRSLEECRNDIPQQPQMCRCFE